jgi:uncharacterized membrane protein (DUF106 family)
MLVTPYDLQDKPVVQDTGYQKKSTAQSFQYGNKFRSAVYAALLFILLSQKVSYKILDLLIKVFSNRVDMIDEDDNPHFIGTIVMAVLIGLIIFLA